MKPSENKPFVYIPYNDGTKNLHAATLYGTFATFMRHELPTDPEGVSEFVALCKDWISDYNPETDCILLIGDPVLMSIVSALTAKQHSYYNVLKFDRQSRSYIKIRIDLKEEGSE